MTSQRKKLKASGIVSILLASDRKLEVRRNDPAVLGDEIPPLVLHRIADTFEHGIERDWKMARAWLMAELAR